MQHGETLVLHFPAQEALARNGGFASRRGAERSRGAGVRHPGAAPLDERRRLVRRAELHNEDGKIVVRVEVDEPADGSGGAGDRCAAHAWLRRQAERARQLVSTVLEPAADEPTGSDATGPSVSIRSHRRLLLAAELAEFLAAMRDNLPGVLDDVDTEFLHDFRVAVRRTRSTLKLGRPALPGGDARVGGSRRSSGSAT